MIKNTGTRATPNTIFFSLTVLIVISTYKKLLLLAPVSGRNK